MSQPLKSFSVGAFSVSLWENPVEGTDRTMKSVSMRRGFFNKRKNQMDNQTVTMNPSEIGCVINLLTQMEQAVIEKRQPNGEETDGLDTPVEGVPY